MPGPCVELNMTLLMVVTDPGVKEYSQVSKRISAYQVEVRKPSTRVFGCPHHPCGLLHGGYEVTNVKNHFVGRKT